MKTKVTERKERLERELKRILDVLKKEYQPEKIILFGSLAQGEVHEWSDLDLAIIKESREKFYDRIGEVLTMVDSKVGLNVVVYTPQEAQRMTEEDNYFFVDEIIGRGKVLYEKK